MALAKKKTVEGRRDLYRLVDVLPPREVATARRFLEYLRDIGTDPVYRALMHAPTDDESETPEEAVAVKVAREQLARGDVVAWADVKRQLRGRR
jgi:hypothetical protein